jgi:hypothetical protein
MANTVATFVASTFLFSWILWIPPVLEYFEVFSLGSASNVIYFTLLIVGAFGPAFGAFMALRSQGKSFKSHLRAFWSREGINKWPLWLAIIIIVPLLINGSSQLIGMAIGLDIPASPLPDLWLYFPTFLMVTFIGGGQEELGWRGYLQGELMEKYGLVRTSSFIGLIWGLWHAPLWFMIHDEHDFTPYIGFVLMTISVSFVYSYIYILTNGNKPIQILFHGSTNAAAALLYVLYANNAASEQSLYWVYVGVNILAALIVVFLTRKRIGSSSGDIKA